MKPILPQLATLVAKPPTGENWLHEVKFDGYRLICVMDDSIKLFTRRQQDWTHKFPSLVHDLKKLKLKQTILDGEVVILDENLRSNFQLLQNSLNSHSDEELVYYVFDLIYYQGKDLSLLPLLERKELLKKIFSKKSAQNLAVRFSDHILGSGDNVFTQACQLHQEGIVSKEINSPYLQKRTKNWLKVKCIQRQEFVIGGFTKPQGKRSHFGSLLIGYFENRLFRYCGHVGTGFSENTLTTLNTLLKKHKTEQCPYMPPIREPRLGSWVKPKIVVEVEFTEWTQDGVLRHPSFKGIREDKNPESIGREKALF